MLMFSCLLLSFVAYHQFSIASFKTVPLLERWLKRRERCKGVRVGQRPVRVDAPCRGPKAERVRRRVAKVVPPQKQQIVDEASKRPSGHGGDAPFQRH